MGATAESGSGEDADGMDVASDLRATLSRLLENHLDGAVRAEAAGGAFPARLWAAIEELGLPLALVPEEAGGFGIPPRAALTLLTVAGETALPLPIADAMLGAWLLAKAGLPAPGARISVAQGGDLMIDAGGRLSGRVWNVPWGRHADGVVALAAGPDGLAMTVIPAAAAQVETGQTIAGDPSDDLALRNAVAPSVRSPVSPESFEALGACTRVLMIAGALGAITASSVAYAQERKQFGKIIGKFQAVQQNLAVLAGEAAAALAAAGLAADAFARGGDALVPRIASAKVRAGNAAGIGAAIAHQVHGAIGFTQEHHLHEFTRRLWAWRDEFGREAVWAERLGRHMSAGGPGGLWAALTAL